MTALVASFGRELRGSNKAECARLIHGTVGHSDAALCSIDLPFGCLCAPLGWIGREGPFIVIADARIDDRATLADRLGSNSDIRTASPAQLIALAWAKWGQTSPDRLIGDFAFIVADQRNGTIHLVRDFMSRRPLHHRLADGRLSVASRPSTLADAEAAVDIDSVARHLALFPQTGKESFFRGVDRVEPGTIVSWSDGRTAIRRFWEAPPPTRRIDRTEAVETAATLLRHATVDRLSDDPSGGALQLSGGMDSSMVAVAAGRAGLKAHALTGVAASGADSPPSGYLPEDGSIASHTAALFPSLTMQRCVAIPRPWQAIVEDWNRASDQPLRNYENADWIGTTVRAAANHGATTLLTGDFGNDSLSHDGTAIFAEDVRHNRWASLIRNARSLRSVTGARWRGIAAYALGPRMPAGIWRSINGFPSPIKAVACTGLMRRNHPLISRLVARAANDSHDLSMRPPTSCWAVRSRMVGWVDTGLFTDALRRRFSVTLTDPTADRRLVDFTLSLPAEHWFVEGRQRSFARAMLAGRVSNAVINPAGRGLQGCDWRQSAEPSLPWLRDEVRRLHSTELGEALDLPRISRLLDQWPRENWSSPTQLATYRYALMRAISMGHFARIRDKRPQT